MSLSTAMPNGNCEETTVANMSQKGQGKQEVKSLRYEVLEYCQLSNLVLQKCWVREGNLEGVIEDEDDKVKL